MLNTYYLQDGLNNNNMINILFILIKLFIMLKKPFNKSWGQALKNNQSRGALA